MTLTPAQNTTLKDHILATPELNALPNTTDGNIAIADILNLTASPDYTVWKTNVSITEVGDNFDGAEFGNLTTANTGRLTAFALHSAEGINPSLADRRALYDDVFSTGGITEAKLLILWKRLSNEIEKLFATGAGAGSDADPDTLDFEGNITGSEVSTARNS